MTNPSSDARFPRSTHKVYYKMTVEKGRTVVLLSNTIVREPAAVEAALARFPGADHQLMERVEQGAAILEDSKFSTVFVAHYPESDNTLVLSDKLLEFVQKALVPGGKLDGQFSTENRLPFVLSGLVESNGVWTRPAVKNATVSLKRTNNGNTKSVVPKFKREVCIAISVALIMGAYLLSVPGPKIGPHRSYWAILIRQ